MVRALRTSLSARLGAVAVALALTGAPALAARPPEGEHRCECRTHGGEHECECARCHMAAAKQQDASAKAPRCHGHVASDGERAPARPASGGPCITGTCGGPDRTAAPLTALDAFTLPLPLAPGGVLPPAGSVERPAGTQRDAPSRPETPPPRAARETAGRA